MEKRHFTFQHENALSLLTMYSSFVPACFHDRPWFLGTSRILPIHYYYVSVTVMNHYSASSTKVEIHLSFKGFLSKMQRFGSISFWCGSGSRDPYLVKVDPDPRIHLSIILDPDPRIHIWKKWIRIRIWIRVLWIFFDYDYFSSSLKLKTYNIIKVCTTK